MKQDDLHKDLHVRLKKVLGQVQAIDKMIEQEAPCEDVLTQISAAKAALHSCGKIILEDHIKQCVLDGIEHSDADKAIENFTTAVDRFASMS
jgi:CsoR family transcriptional regulator, copper-sensing transcriptional repressor